MLGVAVALAGAVLVNPRTAAAFSCEPPRQLSPLDGAVAPSNSLIWDVCYETQIDGSRSANEICSPPTLTDSEGHAIGLNVEQQVRATRYARVLTAYRPSEALIVGNKYRLEADSGAS